MLSSIFYNYKKSFSGLSAPAWYLSLVMLINRSGTMVVPFMSIYLTQHLGISIGKAGLVMACFGIGAICGSLVGGKLTDTKGFYPVQLFTLLGGGVLFIILGQMKSFPLICFFTFLLSLVNEAFRPANQTAIAFYSTEANRTRSFTLNRLAINMGWALGSMLGGFLADRNYELLFWVDGLTNIGAAFLLLGLLPYSSQVAANKKAVESSHDKPPSVYNDRPYLYFILLTTLFGVCFFQLFSTLPVFFKSEWHLSGQTVGLVMGLNGLIIALFEMPVVMYFEGKVNNLRMIALGVLLVGISYIILNLLPAGMAAALLSSIIVTVGEICSMPFMNAYWTGRSVHTNRGQYAALYTMAYSIAHVVAPFCGTQLVEAQGFAALWWVVGSITFITAAAYLLLNKRYSYKTAVNPL